MQSAREAIVSVHTPVSSPVRVVEERASKEEKGRWRSLGTHL